VDLSGHGYCSNPEYVPDNECEELDPNGDGKILSPTPYETSEELEESAREDGYSDSLNQGLEAITYLREHRGWWDEYIDWSDSDSIWRFLLALAFTYESFSYSNAPDYSTYIDFMTQAFTNKFWDLFDTYGNAGGLTYIGSMQTIRIRQGNFRLEAWHVEHFNVAYELIANEILQQTNRSTSPNAPYDFGNDWPDSVDPYDPPRGPSNNQFIYVTVDNLAFVVTYEQWRYWFP
jgi:hypothetical protein